MIRRSGWLAPLGILCTSMIAIAGTGPSVAPALAAGGESGVVPIDIGTYNIRADRSLKQFKNAVDQFKPRIQVAGLQEIAEKEKNDYLMGDEGWGYYRPPELRQNPIIWDTQYFEFVDAPDHGYRIASGREIEAKEGGMELKETSYATLVRLYHVVSGNEVSVINVHLLSGASLVGKPWPGRPLRFALLCDQIRGTIRLVKDELELGNEVFVVGDFNVGFQADERERDPRLPYRRFKRIGFRSIWQDGELNRRGTYENAYLDQIWTSFAAADREVAYDIKQSDHHPAIGSYLLDVELPVRND